MDDYKYKYRTSYHFEVEEIIDVIDGDTLKAWIKLPFDHKAKVTIRLASIDTWEKSNRKGRSKEHVAKGLAAKDYVEHLLLQDWQRIWVESYKASYYTDNFGRYLFDLYLEDESGMSVSLAELLRKNGFEKK